MCVITLVYQYRLAGFYVGQEKQRAGGSQMGGAEVPMEEKSVQGEEMRTLLSDPFSLCCYKNRQ